MNVYGRNYYVDFRIGAMFFITIAAAFINIPAIELFLRERPLFV